MTTKLCQLIWWQEYPSSLHIKTLRLFLFNEAILSTTHTKNAKTFFLPSVNTIVENLQALDIQESLENLVEHQVWSTAIAGSTSNLFSPFCKIKQALDITFLHI